MTAQLIAKDKANRIKFALGKNKRFSQESTLEVVKLKVVEPRKVLTPVGRELSLFGSAKAARRAAYQQLHDIGVVHT